MCIFVWKYTCKYTCLISLLIIQKIVNLENNLGFEMND